MCLCPFAAIALCPFVHVAFLRRRDGNLSSDMAWQSRIHWGGAGGIRSGRPRFGLPCVWLSPLRTRGGRPRFGSALRLAESASSKLPSFQTRGSFFALLKQFYLRVSMVNNRKRPRGHRAPSSLPALDLLDVERAVRALRGDDDSTSSLALSVPRQITSSVPPKGHAPPSATSSSAFRSGASSSASAWAPTPAPARTPATPSTTAGPLAAPSTPGGSRPFPAVKPRTRGSSVGFEVAADERDAWLEAYETDKLAATSVGPRSSQVAT